MTIYVLAIKLLTSQSQNILKECVQQQLTYIKRSRAPETVEQRQGLNEPNNMPT